MGSNMNFYRGPGRNVNDAHQPTPSEREIKHETWLKTYTISGKITFETDKKTLVLTVFHCSFHSPLRISYITWDGNGDRTDVHPASDVPNMRWVCPLLLSVFFQELHPCTSSLGRWSAVHVNRKRFDAESNLIRWDTQKLAF